MNPRRHIRKIVLAAALGLLVVAAVALAARPQVNPDPITFSGGGSRLVKKSGGKTSRTPYTVSPTSTEDGTVTAQPVGKTASGKQIFVENDNAFDTAGNGVGLKLKLGTKSEKLIRAELAAGRSPKMTLAASCSTPDSATPVSAKVRF